MQWVAGDLSARTLATTRLSESWIHTGDVAEALGIELEPTDRLCHIARLAWRTVPVRVRPLRDGRAGPGRVRAARARTATRGTSSRTSRRATVIRGDAFDLCRVAAQRVEPAATTSAAAKARTSTRCSSSSAPTPEPHSRTQAPESSIGVGDGAVEHRADARAAISRG